MNDKVRQRNDVLVEFGILIAPLVDLGQAKETPPAADYRVACAQVRAGQDAWQKSVCKLATFAPDIFMQTECNRSLRVVADFLREMVDQISTAAASYDMDMLQRACVLGVDRARKSLYFYLSEIPIEWEPEIFAANTPFTAYMKIKDVIATARSRIHYFDRYLRPQFFDLFLRDIDRSIELRLVTTKGNAQSGVAGVSAVSELASKEFRDYQLIEVDPVVMHDRVLIVDADVFALGQGTDRAGIAPTNFNPSDSSEAAQAEHARIVEAGSIVHQSKPEST